jgi:hypothetical protein
LFLANPKPLSLAPNVKFCYFAFPLFFLALTPLRGATVVIDAQQLSVTHDTPLSEVDLSVTESFDLSDTGGLIEGKPIEIRLFLTIDGRPFWNGNLPSSGTNVSLDYLSNISIKADDLSIMQDYRHSVEPATYSSDSVVAGFATLEGLEVVSGMSLESLKQ